MLPKIVRPLSWAVSTIPLMPDLLHSVMARVCGMCVQIELKWLSTTLSVVPNSFIQVSYHSFFLHLLPLKNVRIYYNLVILLHFVVGGGVAYCVYSTSIGSNYYVTVVNADNTVDFSTTFRFTCYVGTQSNLLVTLIFVPCSAHLLHILLLSLV